MQHLLYSMSNFIICFKSKLVTFCFLGCHHSCHQMLCEGAGIQFSVLNCMIFAFCCLPHHVSAVALLFSQILRWCSPCFSHINCFLHIQRMLPSFAKMLTKLGKGSPLSKGVKSCHHTCTTKTYTTSTKSSSLARVEVLIK